MVREGEKRNGIHSSNYISQTKNKRKYRKSICASCKNAKTTMISNQEWIKHQKN